MQYRGILRLRRPLKHGVVQNWDDIEDVWHDVYTNHLKVPAANQPLLLTETPRNPLQSREKMIEIAIEGLDASEAYLENSGKLALLSHDIYTGVALDIGDGVSTAVPIYEGQTLHYAILRNEDLIDRMHNCIEALLTDRDQLFRQSATGNITRDIKENYLRVGTVKPQEYEMPDGSIMVITENEVTKCTNHLFGAGIGDGDDGLDVMICKCIDKCDEQIRDVLRANIVVCGGTSLIPGLVERLKKELHAKNELFNVTSVDTSDRLDQPWIGGAKLCRSFSRSNWINRALYTEHGSNIVHRYCF
ncbi:actin-2, muscle-specific-like [Atheta coriaria]|uniref:actin-2, muscle-specific-like n=1 Tax=Dalotia coriaria TaxID=877792 RepID=UPI0031F34817